MSELQNKKLSTMGLVQEKKHLIDNTDSYRNMEKVDFLMQKFEGSTLVIAFPFAGFLLSQFTQTIVTINVDNA